MSNFKVFSFCIMGSILEWYDFALFGAISPLLAQLLFPREYHEVALLLVFGIFAVGYLMRPIGGLFFGHIGDKYGRKKSVVWSCFLMSISTAAIGLLPTQSHNFYLLLSIFLILRLMQGFSVGGEYAGIVIFTLETSLTRKYLFFRIGLLYFGVIGGFLLGTAIGKIFLSIHRLHDNAWRIPFLLSIALGIIAVYLRLKVTESPIFLQMEKSKQTLAFPLKEIIIHHYKKIILLILIVCSNSSAFYYIYTFIPAYLAHTLHVKLAYSLDINIIGLLTLAIIVPLIGLLIKKKCQGIFSDGTSGLYRITHPCNTVNQPKSFTFYISHRNYLYDYHWVYFTVFSGFYHFTLSRKYSLYRISHCFRHTDWWTFSFLRFVNKSLDPY